MIISNEQVDLLARIYNTMLQINTKGEDTLVMAECLRALESVVKGLVNTGENNNDIKE